MKDLVQEVAEEYAGRMKDYLAGAGEQALRFAYELGRRALTDNLGVLGLAEIHHQCVAQILRTGSHGSDQRGILERAASFFAETLSPLEMVLRGFKEANAGLRQSLADLQRVEGEIRQQNERLKVAQQEADAERRRYRELFDFAPDGYLVTDLEGNIRDANEAAATLLQTSRRGLYGRSLLGFIADEEREDFSSQLRRLKSGGLKKAQVWQVRIRPSEGALVPVGLAVDVERHTHRESCGLRWLLRDVTEQVRAEAERAALLVREQAARSEAEAARGFGFLAEASSRLAASLDYETTLAIVARLAVPYLADWSFVHIVKEDGRVRQLEVAHGDPAKSDVADRLRRHSLLEHSLGGPFAPLNITESPQIIQKVPEEWLQSAERSAYAEILRELNFRSAMVIPMWARSRLLGTQVLVSAESARRYGASDLALAKDLAHRCALALENSRLYLEVISEHNKVEKASKAKDEFLAILSHELRNPLMPVVGWARVFKNRPTIMEDPILSEGVRSLERNSQHITRLVDDCLDLARISQRKIQMQRQPVDLNKIVLSSAEALRDMAQRKEIRLVVQVSPSSLWLSGDKTRLGQVLMNLLANAIKYTDAGGLVSLRTTRVGDECEIEVHDTGAGIAAEFLDQIFQPFRQGSSAWLTSESGLGIGLAITREIVELHQGRIWASSEGLGHGSIFRVRLPLATTPVSEPVPEIPVSGEFRRVKPARILLIDDSHDALFLMRVELEGLGYSVLLASSGERGLEIAGSERPDLIISDIKMPGLDGYQLIRKLRHMPETASTPAIALTGLGMKADVTRALKAGFSACVCKPPESEKLAELIHKLTDGQE